MAASSSLKRFNSKLPGSEDVLATFKREGVIVGIDEAGRGPVLGPMVYGAAYWSSFSSADDAKARGEAKFDDSKKLTEDTRAALYDFICKPEVPIGFITCELTAQLLSEKMLQCPVAVSLNKIAWECTVELVRKIASQFPVREIYVDTVGKEDVYERYLQDAFPESQVTVRSKADSLFKVVSCASICAKVERDVLLKAAQPASSSSASSWWGSGYPGDERTKDWLRANCHPVFGFKPNVVRFSWQTVKTLLEQDGNVKMEFASEVEAGSMRLAQFLDNNNKRQCCKHVRFVRRLDEFGA